jgi:UDP-3-O-[3-hydroxymyristoyl] glucosamine N-acyltransferase
MVNHFFGKLIGIVWPPEGQAISPDTVIGEKVSLAPGVVIGSRVILEDNVKVGPNTVIANAHIQRNVTIGANCSIGLPGFGYEADEDGIFWRFPHVGGIVIGEDVEIGSNTCIDRGSIGNTMIGQGVKIDNLVHIAHNVQIGDHSLIIANSMLGGSVTIGAKGWIAPSVSIMNQVTIGDASTIGLGAVVLKDVEDHSVMVGNPAKLLRKKETSG